VFTVVIEVVAENLTSEATVKLIDQAFSPAPEAEQNVESVTMDMRGSHISRRTNGAA